MLWAHQCLAKTVPSLWIDQLLLITDPVRLQLRLDLLYRVAAIEVVDDVRLTSLQSNLRCGSLQHLSNIHTPWDTTRIERYLDVLTVLGVRHLVIVDHLSDDALVAIASSDLVTNLHGLFGADVNRDSAIRLLVNRHYLTGVVALPPHGRVSMLTRETTPHSADTQSIFDLERVHGDD